MRKTYAEAGIRPEDVYYVEAHGTGTVAGDFQELQAITSVFCENRPITAGPLLIGSTKSNMGHAETASSLCCIIKVLLSIQRGQIPANLHYVTPNPQVPALVDGRLQVVDRPRVVVGDLFGVSASGVGGANVHVILRGQQPLVPKLKSNFPTLIPFSSRSAEGVEMAFRKIELNPDLEAVQLLTAIHELPIKDHNFRGFALLDTNKFTSVSETVAKNRPLWVVLPGMGTQWAGMGREIMQIDTIRRSLEISASILRPFDLNLIDLVTNQDEEGLRPFGPVAVTALGIALVDFLKSLDLAPEGFIGHSTGDLLCAYLDACWTQEEVLLCQYHKVSLLNELNGDCAMASVGLTWEEAMSQCPEGIYIACHNAENNVTLSGREVELSRLVKALNSNGVFGKMVSTGGVAFHSPYVSHLATRLEPLIKDIIKGPRLKSSKWISTAIVEDSLNQENYVTADYFLHQFVSPVRFHSAVQKIPSNAVVLELGIHSLFQNILKRSLPSSVTLIPTMQRNTDDNVHRLYSAVGSLFVSGFQPKFSALDPQMKNLDTTPNPELSISSLVHWDHSQKYALLDYLHKSKAQHLTKVSLLTKEWEFLKGHMVDGRVIFPAAGYLVLAWKAFASLLNKSCKSLGVKFENIMIHRATVLPAKGAVEFSVNVFENSGNFEISELNTVVVSGRIELLDKEEARFENVTISTGLVLKSEDVYEDFRLRGYEYTGEFCGIVNASLTGEVATLRWHPEWIILLDTLPHLGILSLPMTADALCVPTRIGSVVIDPGNFTNLSNSTTLDVRYCCKTMSVSTLGVQINDILFSSVPRRKREEVHPLIQSWAFVPYMDTDGVGTLQFYDILKILIDIVLENTATKILKVKELCATGVVKSSIVDKVAEIVKLTFGRKITTTAPNAELIILQDLSNFDNFQNVASTFEESGFILVIVKAEISEMEVLKTLTSEFGLLTCLARKNSSGKTFYLLRKLAPNFRHTVVPASNTSHEWLEPLQEVISKGSLTSRAWLTSDDPESGLVGFVNCLGIEGSQSVRCLISPYADVTDELKENDLVMNVLSDGKFGSYRSLNLREISKIPSAHAYLTVLNKGDLNSVAWVEAPVLESIPNKPKISVHFASLNSSDRMLATGNLSLEDAGKQECVFGKEFSGIDPEGTRVMGLVPSKGLSTHVQGVPNLMWTVPDNWTLAQASTVPMAYATAYYALMMRGNLQRGESVLITSGSSGVGQAAITIALSLNCKIFTTAGSTEKKMWLLKKFPNIEKNHILSSQTTGFANEISKFTNHRGVDVVLNSLEEEKLKAALSTVATGGRFLEIGKFDMSQNASLGMKIFLKNIAFHGVNLDSLFPDSEEIASEKQKLNKLLYDGIQSGVVQPLPITIFDYAQAREAFRFIDRRKNTGKVVLRLRSEGSRPPLLKVIPRTYFDPEKMYVLVGGLGRIGLALTAWLISRGARNVTLVGLSGITSGYQQLQISRWRKAGINVLVSQVGLQIAQDCEAFLEKLETMAPVGGIFNLAMVLKERSESQNAANFESVFTSKFIITQNLDQASRKLCPRLDQFVTFSSAAAWYKNDGLMNYGLANSAMERLVAQRRIQGLPALSIAFGPISEVGNLKDSVKLVAGVLPQPFSSCLKTLDNLLHPSFRSDSGLVSSLLLATDMIDNDDKNDSIPPEEGTTTSLTQQIAQMLGLSAAEFESKEDLSLSELGLDSLMVVEAKQVLAEHGVVKGLGLTQIRKFTWVNIQEYEKTTRESKTVK